MSPQAYNARRICLLSAQQINMSRQGRAGSAGKKRKPQAATAAGGSRDDKPSKKAKRTNDAYYEAMDSDPDEEKHADRYDVSTAAMVAGLLLAAAAVGRN
jgi:hypothetical protein